MEDVKANKIDEDGMGLSSVEAALSRIGVTLRDGTHSFRDMDDVLADVGKTWSTLSEVEQQSVSKAIAGVRQKEIFISLMENQAMVQKLLNAETASSGLATERYGIYLESVEAKANKTQAALEGVWQKTITSESIGQVYDMVTNVLGLVDAVGGLVPVVIALGLAYAAINYQTIIGGIGAFIGMITSATSVTGFLTTALAALNITLTVTQVLTGAILVTALAGLVLGLGYMSQEAERATKHLQDLSKAVEDSSKALRDTEKNTQVISDLGKSFDELKTKSILTTEEQQKFVDVQNKIKDLMPQVSGYYDDQGNFVVNLANNQQTLNDIQREALDIKKQQLALDAEAFLKQAPIDYQRLSDDLEAKRRMTERMRAAESKYPDSEASKNATLFADMEEKKAALALKAFVNEAKNNYSKMSQDQQTFWIDYLKTHGDSSAALADGLNPIEEKWATVFGEIDKKNGTAKDSLKAFVAEVSKSKNALKTPTGGEYARAGSTTKSSSKENSKETLRGLAEIQKRLSQTANSYSEYKSMAIEAFNAVGYSVDEHGKVYQDLTSTVDGITTTTRVYNSELGVLSSTQYDITQKAYQLTDAYKAQQQAQKDVANGAFQINTQLKALQETATLTGSMIAKALSGDAFTFADVQKLTEANKDYLQFISIVDGQVQINTEGLRLYDIQKAKDVLVTMAQEMAINGTTAAEEAQLALMGAYIDTLISGTAYTDGMTDAQNGLGGAVSDTSEEEKKAARIRLELLQDQKDAADTLLELTIAMIRQEKEAEKDHLQQQIENYSDLIDARIAALDALKEEEDYKRGIKKDVKKATDIRNQIAILSLDNSPEAKAKILKLQQELAEQTEKIQDKQRDHKLELEKKALEKEKEQYKKALEDKIEDIEEYLKQAGTIANDARDLIENHGEELYARLMAWNRTYGDGVDQTVVDAWEKGRDAVINYQKLITDINDQETFIKHLDSIQTNATGAWGAATAAVKDYSKEVDLALSKKSPEQDPTSFSIPGLTEAVQQASAGLGTFAAIGNTWTALTGGADSPFSDWFNQVFGVHHEGLDSGPVGGLRTASNEKLAKLLKGEIVINGPQQDNILNNIIPSIAKTTSNFNNAGGSVQIGSLLTVQGNMDKSVLPDVEKLLDKAIDKLNKGNYQRGILRGTSLNSI